MGIPNTITLGRRLPDRIDAAEQLLNADPDWMPGAFEDLWRFVYPVFRVEFSYDDGQHHTTAVLDGLRADNDEHLTAYRSLFETPESINPAASYDIRTSDGGQTLLVGHRCSDEQAAGVLEKQLAYASENEAVDDLTPVRRRFDLPDAVDQEQFDAVTDVTRAFIPFWLAVFEDDSSRYKIALEPRDETAPPEPIEWLSRFVVEQQSLVRDSLLTEPARGRSDRRQPSDDRTPSGASDEEIAASTTDSETADESESSPAEAQSDQAGEPPEIVQPKGVESLHAERLIDPTPERGFESVGGMADLKARLRSAVIEPVTEAHRYQEYGLGTVNGVLLHGPPGCGKTYVVGALAGELGWRFIEAGPADLTSKYVGEPAEKVADLFEIARANQPCLVFIDEIDAVAGARDDQDSQSQQQLVNQLLTELEAVADEDVLVAGATNLIDDVDPAIRRSGRFDERIEVPPPDADARREILRVHLHDRPVDPELSLTDAVAATAGFAASDLRLVADEAARIAMEDHEQITEADLRVAAERTATSIEEWIGRYDNLVAEASERGAVVQPDGVDHLDANRIVDREIGRSFDDVGGMAGLKDRLRGAVIEPIEQADEYEAYGLGTVDGILLYGPPGCGKTYVSQALAGELGHYLLDVTPADLTSKYVGEPAEKVADLFEIARANQPCIVLLDEIDAVAGTRTDTGTQSQQQLVNQLLTELETVADEEVVVVGTTNLIDDVDPAVRRSGRFDERIEVPPPDADARREILRVHLEDRPHAAEIDWHQIAERTDGFAASDIELLAEEAARAALREGQVVTTDILASTADTLESSIDSWQAASSR